MSPSTPRDGLASTPDLLARVPLGELIVFTDLEGALLDAAGAASAEPDALAATGALLGQALEELGHLLGAGPVEAAVLVGGPSALYLLPLPEGSIVVALGGDVGNPVAALKQAVGQFLTPPSELEAS